MPEILTESFCERCGTRYTFESAAPRAARLKGVKVLSRGLRNFVMSDDTSMDEAMASARSETDREVTSQQLDAFHKTFNFCMSCRQYTCANCWNEADGQCLSCSPHLGHEILPAPFPDLDPSADMGMAHANGTNGHAIADTAATLAWPTMDLERDLEPVAEATMDDLEPIDASARLAALGATDAPEAPIDEAVKVDIEAEPIEVSESVEAIDEADAAGTTPTQDPPVVAATDSHERAAATATSNTSDMLRRFRPGQSLDAEIEAFEQAQVPDRGAEGPVEVREEPAAVEADVTMPDGPVGEPAIRDDVVAQPTWQIVAPETPVDATTPDDAGPTIGDAPVPAPATAPEPQWPAQPEWPSHRPAAAGLPFLGRPAQPTGDLESLWAESAREVAAVPAPFTLGSAPASPAGGVQPCVSCGLSLSATARFCRRCGTRQG
ncbi:MAG: hypothetical protein WEC14_08350 [Chloroflexota bacterium]